CMARSGCTRNGTIPPASSGPSSRTPILLRWGAPTALLAPWSRRPPTSPLHLMLRLRQASLPSSISKSIRRRSRLQRRSTRSARRRWPHRLETRSLKKKEPALSRGLSLVRAPSALGDDDSLAALFNDLVPVASACRLLAHFDCAHPVLGLDPYAKAVAADDDAGVWCRTFLDDPATPRRRFLNDVEVRQRRGRDCRQPNANHQSLHVFSPRWKDP